MTRIRWNRNSFSRTIKDYIVPIIWWFVILIVIFNSLWNEGKIDNQALDENRVWIEASLKWDNAEAYIVYPWDTKKSIQWNIKVYKWEKILIKEWNVSLSYLPWVTLELGRLWELKYWSDGSLSLFNSDLWVNTSIVLDISMSYANVVISENSVVSLSQNEVWSTVYLLKWTVEVSNLTWESTMLTGGQKLTVSRDNAANKDVDLQIQKEDIDNFFKWSDWFIKNSWDLYLWNNDEEKNDTQSWTTFVNNKSLISISSFKDEDRVPSSTVDIKWSYLNSDISVITVDWEITKLDTENNTFSFTNYSLDNSVNDIVVKVFDIDRNLIWKYVYTLYLENWWASTSNNTWFKVKTYNIDASNFKFSSPDTSWTFITFADFVTIKWSVPASTVSKVVVNDYKLNSFNWTTWRYHARSDYNNLKDWTNIYEVKYYWLDGSLIYTNHYTIIKKNTKVEKKKIISDEA